MKTHEELQVPLNGSSGAQEYLFDGSLLMRIAKRRRRAWILFGAGILLASLAIAFFVFPQNYSATVSLSMQKPDAAPSALMALTGGGSKKYLGVLRSRNFAEKVDKVVNFRQVMGLPDTPRDQEDAIDKVMKDLKVEDNSNDGLLYITVNLSGPPALLPDPESRKKRFRDAVSLAANAYKDALADFLKNQDTDKELALLRGADSQVRQAQISYDASIEELGNFIKHNKVLAVATSAATSGGGSADTATTGSQLTSLYVRKAELEQKIKSSESVTSGTKSLLTAKQDLSKMPEEDPLLITARRQVNDAAANLEILQITFGSSMQSVKRAQERLKLAEEQLHKEVETILNGNTSDNIKRQALQAEYETVERQIAQAEKNFQYNRNMSVEMEKRRNNVLLKLESLKAILTDYAKLKLQTVSAQNRMVTIDEARPPRSGKPGMGMLAAICLLVPFFFIGSWWVIEYLLNTQSKSAR